jgi:hypothetical protein
MKPKNEQTVGAYVALPRKEDGVTGYICQAEHEEPKDGCWLKTRYDPARQGAAPRLRGAGAETAGDVEKTHTVVARH